MKCLKVAGWWKTLFTIAFPGFNALHHQRHLREKRFLLNFNFCLTLAKLQCVYARVGMNVYAL